MKKTHRDKIAERAKLVSDIFLSDREKTEKSLKHLVPKLPLTHSYKTEIENAYTRLEILLTKDIPDLLSEVAETQEQLRKLNQPEKEEHF